MLPPGIICLARFQSFCPEPMVAPSLRMYVLVDTKNVWLLALQIEHFAPGEIGARVEVLEDLFNDGEVSGFIHRPAHGREVLAVLHGGGIEPPGFAKVGRDMLPVKGFAGFPTGLFQRFEGADFDVQSVRVGGRVGVAEVIHARCLESANDFIHEPRVHQRAVAGDAHHHIGLVRPRGLHKAVKNIVFTALFAGIAKLANMLEQRLVALIDRGGDDDLAHLFCLGQALEQYLNHRDAANRLHHLIRQTGGTHTGLDERDNFHNRGQRAGLIRFSASQCRSGKSSGTTPAAALIICPS